MWCTGNAYFSYLRKYAQVLMMTVFLKLMNFESALCNDCGHTKNDDGVWIDWSLYLDNSSNDQTIRGMLDQLMVEVRGEFLENLM